MSYLLIEQRHKSTNRRNTANVVGNRNQIFLDTQDRTVAVSFFYWIKLLYLLCKISDHMGAHIAATDKTNVGLAGIGRHQPNK